MSASSPLLRSPWRLVAVLAAGASVLAAVIALAFTWTSVNAEPRNIPVGIVATDSQYKSASSQVGTDAITLHRVTDRASALEQIEQRDLYGAIILEGDPEVVIASAASPVIGQALTDLAPTLEGVHPGDAPVAITDIAPWQAGDPAGAGFAAAGFPVVLTGFLGGVFISFLIHGRTRRLTTALAYSAVVAVLLTVVFQPILGILHGNPLLNAVTIALTALSGTGIIAGLNTLLGRLGLPLGVFFLLLLANPLSGFAMPAAFYPAPWGEIGQWLAPGAAATLLKAHSYFPHQDIHTAWITLAAWAAIGVLLLLSRHGHALVRPAPVVAPVDPAASAGSVR
ncbi:MAG: hypothetical protein ACTH0V_12825 [Microbacteriaceae bacterium]|uniref:hypothetical protein n=3 Tax=Actinomycetes TaxID=1760 RepID=UPI000FCBB3AB|nr:hypothetical protein [Brevibacterium aurantiacum]